MTMNKNISHSAGDQLAHEERVRRCAELGIVVPINARCARHAGADASVARAKVSTNTAPAKQ